MTKSNVQKLDILIAKNPNILDLIIGLDLKFDEEAKPNQSQFIKRNSVNQN